MERLLRVGLTGGIGSGKSTVAKLLELMGAEVYLADDRAKGLMVGDESLRAAIKTLFGNKAYCGRALNRAYLAERIFGDPALRGRMNQLVHPAVQRDFDRWADEITHAAFLVEEAAILIESGAARRMDCLIVVTAPETLRIERVVKRDGVSEKEAWQRIAAQMNDTERIKQADYVIVADDCQLLIPQVVKIHEELSMRHFR